MGFLGYLVRKKNYVTLLATFVMAIFLMAALLAPFLFDWETATRVTLDTSLLSPSLAHPLGTDELGRDLLARVVWGARITLIVALVSVAIAMILGVLIGSLCGYYENWFTDAVMRFMDFMIAFPRTLLAIIVVTVLGSGVLSLTLAIGISTIPANVRLFRGPILALKRRQFTVAAKALGARDSSILFSHILPNTTSLIIIQGTLSLAEAILIGSGLSFLGLGPQPPIPEWGAMIAASRAHITSHPHVILAPGITLFAVILAFNLVGDALRDYADPRSRKAI
ncbi:peptide/nickel transport system permease protein [Bosea sp. AK1]|jgi:peptide/nickel transport system permease protein|uniref:Peptide/nickel transport system permease protein n=2 Tax=Bosea TaxID=85413 RepID=A0ABY0P669_9HYPH|nr:peptide/nickel transport system permease protein [Bosea sp. AK1]SDG84209.1 peptide/nickel transport system permease protein [Bosea robiniae]